MGIKPKVVIFLDIDASEAYKRKQDYSFKETELGVSAYRELFSKLKGYNITTVRSTKKIHEIEEIIFDQIIRY